MNKAKANSAAEIIIRKLKAFLFGERPVKAHHRWALVPVKVKNMPGRK